LYRSFDVSYSDWSAVKGTNFTGRLAVDNVELDGFFVGAASTHSRQKEIGVLGLGINNKESVEPRLVLHVQLTPPPHLCGV